MGTLPNKREVIQSILDKQKDLWIIIKPSRLNPTDPDYLCVFQNPAEYKEARVEIPTAWFQDREKARIEGVVQDAIRRAELGYKFWS